MWYQQLGMWLLQCTLSGAVILAIGAVAMRFCKEPVDRVCVIRWTFLACLIVPLIRHWELLPGIPLPILSVSQENIASSRTEPITSNATNPRFVVPIVTAQEAEASVSPEFQKIVPDDVMTTNAAVAFARINVPSTTGTIVPWTLVDRLIAGCELLYAAVLCGMAAFWGIGFLQRRRIEKSAVPGSESLQAVLEAVADDPRSRQIRLLVSEHVDSPIMWGIWQPTIVVPSALASDLESAELRYGLAHEWSHVQRRDFVAYSMANLAKLVCFHQPAYWWLRKQLILGQDFLADAFAAQQAAEPEDYASYLVSLARSRQAGLAGTLGVKDRRSRLYQRIAMLVQDGKPLLQQQRRVSLISMSAATVILILLLGAVQLRAAAQSQTDSAATDKQQVAADKQAPQAKVEISKEQKSLPDPITYVGQVVDSETGLPIANAEVEIDHSLNVDPNTRKWVHLETTKHATNELGFYRFTLPPDQVAQGSLYLEVDTHHPDYQPKGRSGYSHAMIRKNLENGEPPFYSLIKLAPGKPVTAKVQNPDGSPAANIHVMAYTKAPSKEPGLSFERGAFQKSTTNEQGDLRIVCATPGDGVIWLYPKDFAPMAIRIKDRRGDIGPIRLQDGQRVSGQVLNARGKPVPNVAIEIRRQGDGEEADEFLGRNAVANGIRGTGKTDENGRFELSPLPPGKYRAQIENRYHAPGAAGGHAEELVVNDVFVPMEVTIAADAAVRPLEIRAIPHVVLKGRFFNSKGEPRASHEQHVFGRINGQHYFAQSTVPGADGWYEFKLPHGIEEIQMSFSTNEHSALRWRLRPGEPLQYGYHGHLDKLEEDFTTIEVIRYSAPMVLLKAVDEQGNPLRDFIPNSKYKSRPAEENRGKFISGAQGDIGFEGQPDGRWRSSQMLPDEETTIMLVKEGYATEPQVVSMKEGDVKELVFVMKKKPSEDGQNEASK